MQDANDKSASTTDGETAKTWTQPYKSVVAYGNR